MKKFLFLSCVLVFAILCSTQISYCADIGGFNNMQHMQSVQQMQNPFYDMQQLQNQYRAKKNSFNEFQNFDEQKKANQERIRRDNERQQRLEAQAQKVRSTKKFVNDNGVIKIENVAY